jgi:hypothetical protein
MHDRMYEALAKDHVNDLLREADARHLAAQVERPGAAARWRAIGTTVRGSLVGLASAVRRAPFHGARPRRDLGPARRP